LTRDIQKLDQGLQSEVPVPGALAWNGKAYTVVWARTEAVESPDEEGEPGTKPVKPPEIGPIQVAQVAPRAKKAASFRRLTGERIGPRELEAVHTTNSTSFFYEDESGVHFLQRTAAGKSTGESLIVRGAHLPSLSYSDKTSGLWLAWAPICGEDGALKLLKVPAKDLSVDQAVEIKASGLRCDKSASALATSGPNLALSWLAQAPLDKRGKPGPVSVQLLFGDAEKSTFEKPISLKLSPNLGTPSTGPALVWRHEKAKTKGKETTPEVHEVAVAWHVAEGALGFAVLRPDGSVVVAPRLVPGSQGAKELAPSLSFDGKFYALSWTSPEGVWLGLMNPSGEMPTAPLLLSPGEKPALARGSSAKEYSFTLWRNEESLISSKALFFGGASCFAPVKKSKAQ
jgi:hypothetical protein